MDQARDEREPIQADDRANRGQAICQDLIHSRSRSPFGLPVYVMACQSIPFTVYEGRS
jgi:hypothetical protein